MDQGSSVCVAAFTSGLTAGVGGAVPPANASSMSATFSAPASSDSLSSAAPATACQLHKEIESLERRLELLSLVASLPVQKELQVRNIESPHARWGLISLSPLETALSIVNDAKRKQQLAAARVVDSDKGRISVLLDELVTASLPSAEKFFALLDSEALDQRGASTDSAHHSSASASVSSSPHSLPFLPRHDRERLLFSSIGVVPPSIIPDEVPPSGLDPTLRFKIKPGFEAYEANLKSVQQRTLTALRLNAIMLHQLIILLRQLLDDNHGAWPVLLQFVHTSASVLRYQRDTLAVIQARRTECLIDSLVDTVRSPQNVGAAIVADAAQSNAARPKFSVLPAAEIARRRAELRARDRRLVKVATTAAQPAAQPATHSSRKPPNDAFSSRCNHPDNHPKSGKQFALSSVSASSSPVPQCAAFTVPTEAAQQDCAPAQLNSASAVFDMAPNDPPVAVPPANSGTY